MATAVQLLSLEEFLARPDREDDQREELIDGELILSPGAKVSQSEIVARVRTALASLEQQGFVLRNDFSCVLGTRSMPVPDLAAVRRDRWESAVVSDGFLIGSPELAIEVASPSNRRLYRKAAAYLDHGAEQVWIVYPKTKTVSVVTSEGTTEARVGEAVDFRGVSVPVSSIFR